MQKVVMTLAFGEHRLASPEFLSDGGGESARKR